MKKIGILGGVAWRSTVEYYSGICELSEERSRLRSRPGAPSTPEIAIESLDLAKAVALLGNDDDENTWEGFDAYHRAALLRLQQSGADFALIASNTPHHRFPSLVRGLKIPVLDLFDIAAREAASLGVRDVVILGTQRTMRSDRLRHVFEQHGACATPPPRPHTRERVVELIDHLQNGTPGNAASALEAIVQEVLSDRNGSPAIFCLACTELPLAFPEGRRHGSFLQNGVRYLNTTALHVRAAVDLCWPPDSTPGPPLPPA